MRRKLSARGVAVSAADDVQAMERSAVPRAARLSGAGAVHAAGILARLRQCALPPRAALPRAAAVLLGAQTSDAAGRLGEGGSRLPAAACAVLARLPQRLGRPVAVLNFFIRPRAQRGGGGPCEARWRGHAAVRHSWSDGASVSARAPSTVRFAAGPPSPLRGAGWGAPRSLLRHSRVYPRQGEHRCVG